MQFCVLCRVIFTLEKAKPKTIADIAQILQQITKENKERKQKPEAAFSTEPATPNQYNAGIDPTNKTFSTLKVHTVFSNFPAKVAFTLVENEPARDVSDREAKAEDEQKNLLLRLELVNLWLLMVFLKRQMSFHHMTQFLLNLNRNFT